MKRVIGAVNGKVLLVHVSLSSCK